MFEELDLWIGELVQHLAPQFGATAGCDCVTNCGSQDSCNCSASCATPNCQSSQIACRYNVDQRATRAF